LKYLLENDPELLLSEYLYFAVLVDEQALELADFAEIPVQIVL
jgi:hypothetical protein